VLYDGVGAVLALLEQGVQLEVIVVVVADRMVEEDARRGAHAEALDEMPRSLLVEVDVWPGHGGRALVSCDRRQVEYCVAQANGAQCVAVLL